MERLFHGWDGNETMKAMQVAPRKEVFSEVFLKMKICLEMTFLIIFIAISSDGLCSCSVYLHHIISHLNIHHIQCQCTHYSLSHKMCEWQVPSTLTPLYIVLQTISDLNISLDVPKKWHHFPTLLCPIATESPESWLSVHCPDG